MFPRLRELMARFATDPFGACIEAAVYLFLVAIGVVILITFARVSWNMVVQALN